MIIFFKKSLIKISLKVFTCFKDAYEFSYGGWFEPNSITENIYENCNDSSLLASTRHVTQDAEKLPYPAPRKPEVNEMRSFIEKNFFEKFREKVIANPRFLISSGDAPVVYQVRKLHTPFLNQNKMKLLHHLFPGIMSIQLHSCMCKRKSSTNMPTYHQFIKQYFLH